MKNSKFKSSIVLGLVILFIGASVVQISGLNINKNLEVYINNQNNIEYVPGEFIVKFKSDINIGSIGSSNGFISTGISSIDILNENMELLKLMNFLILVKNLIFIIFSR